MRQMSARELARNVEMVLVVLAQAKTDDGLKTALSPAQQRLVLYSAIEAVVEFQTDDLTQRIPA